MEGVEEPLRVEHTELCAVAVAMTPRLQLPWSMSRTRGSSLLLWCNDVWNIV